MSDGDREVLKLWIAALTICVFAIAIKVAMLDERPVNPPHSDVWQSFGWKDDRRCTLQGAFWTCENSR